MAKAKIDPEAALREIARRNMALRAASALRVQILAECFDKQVALIEDPARNKAALCTRRAGKTSTWPRYTTIVAMEKPRALIRIWAINRLRAKQLLWDEFKLLFARHKIKVQMHETELTIRFENGSEIRLLGADKDKEAQKKRGDKTDLEIVLETQLFGPFLRTLVEDVAEPCLFDTQGTICLEGTPGPVQTGYWYNVTGDETEEHRWVSKGMLVATGETDNGQALKELVGAGWSCHHWSLVDNPMVDQWRGRPQWRLVAAAAVDAVRARKHWTIDNPTFIREYKGRWVRDDSALFYKYNEARNSFTLAEVQPWGPGWSHVLGWDLGSKDDMALGVWGWHPERRELYEAAEWKKPGALAEEVMSKIKQWEDLGFNFVAKVADTGGGGRMYVEDVMSRFQQVFEAAKKTEKVEHVRVMNDEFVTGRLKVQRGGGYAQELSTLPKDPDWDPDSGRPPGEDPRFPNHLSDCFLYAFRRALPHIDFDPVGPVETDAERIEREMIEALEEREARDPDQWEEENYDGYFD